LLGGAATAWPVAVRAQQLAMPVVGFLHTQAEGPIAPLVVPAFRSGLGEAGYIEGQNVAIEYRWAEGHYDRLPVLAAELVAHHVSVIAATGGEPSALAAKGATSAIPIAFVVSGDPLKAGLVASFNRPGGNVTGITLLTSVMEAKRLGLVRELVSNATTIAMLVNPNYPTSEAQVNERAAFHSIASSASASNLSGTSSTSALAAFRLMTNSNLVGCITGTPQASRP
jgi:ABC-type uncharacterized transport system substrate-binding protein